jgi:hypothetical protein
MYKLPKDTEKAIDHLVKKLPKTNKVLAICKVVTGCELLEKNPHAKDRHGDPIDMFREYTETKTMIIPVDHKKKMTRLYKKMGDGGIRWYLSSIINEAKKQRA